MQDYLDRAAPGVSADYLVIPRALAQSMPLRWQQVFVGLLTDLHNTCGHLTWPEYRVVPSRWEIVSDLDEGQLAVQWRRCLPTSAPTVVWSIATSTSA